MDRIQRGIRPQTAGRSRYFTHWSGETFRKTVSLTLGVSFALSVTLSNLPQAFAGPGDLNSNNDGRDIQGGTYFNTPGSRTTFQNSSGGGLWLHSGDLVRGLESDASKVPTGNGGTLYFRAPNNVIRLDGNIDVSAIRNGSLYVGNGGKVFVDSAYLFQNGSIFANGVNGGLIQFNVGGMTVGPNARITAQGFGGDGGAIDVNSRGLVDIRRGAVLDTSGKVIGTVDTNVINIEGGIVNNEGILRADGVAAANTDFKADNGDAAVIAANPQLLNNPVPGPISPGSGTGDTATMRNILFATPGNADFRGGTIRLVAAGQSQSVPGIINAADSTILSATDKNNLNTRANSLQGNNGDVLNRGRIEANGAFGKNGGTIMLAAARNVTNSSNITANGADPIDGIFDANGNGANGGNGGTIVIAAKGAINNSSGITANGGRGSRAQSLNVSTSNNADATANVTGTGGNGGQGGMIVFSSNNITNTGNVRANGGAGGAGGNANAYDSESSSQTISAPIANATATGGKGGSGGQGGLIEFSGNGNPIGGGLVQVNGGQGGKGGNAWADAQSRSNTGIPVANATATAGAGGTGGAGGTLVTVNPTTFTMQQSFAARAGGSGDSGSGSTRTITTRNGLSITNRTSTPVVKGSALSGPNTAILATTKQEYLRHDDTAILLSQSGGTGILTSSFANRFNNSTFRTVGNPVGVSGSNDTAFNDAESATNLFVASTAPLDLVTDRANSNINPLFFNMNTMTILNNGNLTNNMLWTPGVHVVGAGFHDITFSLGGGHISWLTNGNITNNQITMTRGLWTGGSIQLAASQDLLNNNDIITIGPDKALLEGFAISGPLYESSHSGSITLKAGRNLTNAATGKIEDNHIFYDIHPPLNQNPPIEWPRFLNGAQIGASINLIAGNNLTNAGTIRADAITFRNGPDGAANPALSMGGIIFGRAGGTISNTGTTTALGRAFFDPNASTSPFFAVNTFAETTDSDGTVDIHR